MKRAPFVNPDLWTFSNKTSKYFVNSSLTIILEMFRFYPFCFYIYFTIFEIELKLVFRNGTQKD